MIKLDLNPGRQALRQFAWVALVGVPLLAFVGLRIAGAFAWDHPVLLAAAGLGALQLALILTVTDLLTRVVYVVLTAVAIPVGFVVSHVLMAIIYYLIVVPIALVFRAMGRDVLGRRLDPAARSYWHVRAGDRAPSSYFKLY